MISLTVQQRDILHYLLDSNDSPITIANIADHLKLSSRQISYRLDTIKLWLAQYDVALETIHGVGLKIDCSPPQRKTLLSQLNRQADFQMVLTASERQQLFSLNLLTHLDPIILKWWQHNAAVSRTTILKDLVQRKLSFVELLCHARMSLSGIHRLDTR